MNAPKPTEAKRDYCPHCGADATGYQSRETGPDWCIETWYCYKCHNPFEQHFEVTFAGQTHATHGMLEPSDPLLAMRALLREIRDAYCFRPDITWMYNSWAARVDELETQHTVDSATWDEILSNA